MMRWNTIFGLSPSIFFTKANLLFSQTKEHQKKQTFPTQKNARLNVFRKTKKNEQNWEREEKFGKRKTRNVNKLLACLLARPSMLNDENRNAALDVKSKGSHQEQTTILNARINRCYSIEWKRSQKQIKPYAAFT